MKEGSFMKGATMFTFAGLLFLCSSTWGTSLSGDISCKTALASTTFPAQQPEEAKFTPCRSPTIGVPGRKQHSPALLLSRRQQEGSQPHTMSLPTKSAPSGGPCCRLCHKNGKDSVVEIRAAPEPRLRHPVRKASKSCTNLFKCYVWMQPMHRVRKGCTLGPVGSLLGGSTCRHARARTPTQGPAPANGLLRPRASHQVLWLL